MEYKQFIEKWIEENIPVSFYGNTIKKCVRELATVFMKQHHRGQSASLVLSFFVRMMKDYDNPHPLRRNSGRIKE